VWREHYDDCYFVIGGDFNVDLDCPGDQLNVCDILLMICR